PSRRAAQVWRFWFSLLSADDQVVFEGAGVKKPPPRAGREGRPCVISGAGARDSGAPTKTRPWPSNWLPRALPRGSKLAVLAENCHMARAAGARATWSDRHRRR